MSRGMGVPSWHVGHARASSGQCQKSRLQGAHGSGGGCLWRGRAAALRARWGRLHLVTRSSSKALMPWAAFSRVSSLAGGPCQTERRHGADGTRALSPHGPRSPSASSSSLATREARQRTRGHGAGL